MFLADKEAGKLVKDNFVVVTLVVMESKEKKDLENAGGLDLMKQWDGEGAGLPFMVVLNASGKKLADSTEKSADGKKIGNIGYPARPNEIAWFMKMLDTAPRLNKADKGKIEAWLKANAPKM